MSTGHASGVTHPSRSGRPNNQMPDRQIHDSQMNDVTVVVFKDNLASRTFRIPLSWISSVSWTFSLALLFGLSAIFLAIKYYRVARKADLSHVQVLEQSILELQNQLAEVRKTERPEASNSVSSLLTPAGQSGTPEAENKSPPQAPTLSGSKGAPVLFSAFSPSISEVLSPAARENLRIRMSTPTSSWVSSAAGKTLKVQFKIFYSREDGGSQQGRIIILARGPNMLLSYPQNILNDAGSTSLISPEKGEYFSVARYRETEAEFGPVKSKEDLRSIEILIIGNESDENPNGQQKLLILEQLNLSAPKSPKSDLLKDAPPRQNTREKEEPQHEHE